MKIGLQVTSESSRQMHRAFNSVKKSTYQGAWNMINRMAMFTAGSASKAAKISARKRELATFAGTARQRSGGYRYGVKAYGIFAAKHGGADGMAMQGQWVMTNDKAKAEALREIRFRGLAKASWASIMMKMGLKGMQLSAGIRGLEGRVWPVARGTTWVSFGKAARPMFIMFKNSLRYMAKIQPTILVDAMASAERRMAGAEANIVAKQQKRAWRRAA